MKKALSKAARGGLIVGMLILIVVFLGTVMRGDVVVKEGDLTAGMALTVTNYDFVDGEVGWSEYPTDDWTFTSGSTGKASCAGNDGATLQPSSALNIVSGRIYKVAFDAVIEENDGITVSLGGDSCGVSSSGGTSKVVYLLAVNTDNLVFEYMEEGGDLATLDNVVVTQYNSLATGKLETSIIEGLSCTASGDLGAVAVGLYTVASGSQALAAGFDTEASGHDSTALGLKSTASGQASLAAGYYATASASYSTGIGYHVDATAYKSTAFGKYSTNSVADSFTVGYGSSGSPQVDFRVASGLVTVYDDLYVTYDVDANTYSEHSSFYNKDTYGRALDYAKDSSETIKVTAEGKNEYDHEADPEFLKKWVSVKDYDKYSDEEVWNEEIQEFETVRTYETHQELRSSLSMKTAWLRQCVFELKQENESLRAELAAIKQHVGME